MTQNAKKKCLTFRACIAICMVWFVALFPGGCSSLPDEDMGANQSLVEIGEYSLERAEALENQGRGVDANVAYRRALWAFRYHERLTGEQPFLLDEALEGVERTSPKRK